MQTQVHGPGGLGSGENLQRSDVAEPITEQSANEASISEEGLSTSRFSHMVGVPSSPCYREKGSFVGEFAGEILS